MPVRPQVTSGESLNRFVCKAWFVMMSLTYLNLKFRVIIRVLLGFLTRVISSTNFNAQFSLFIYNMFVTLLSSTCFEH